MAGCAASASEATVWFTDNPPPRKTKYRSQRQFGTYCSSTALDQVDPPLGFPALESRAADRFQSQQMFLSP